MNKQYARPSSRQRHIWPAIIGLAISAASAAAGMSAQAKARKKQEEQMRKQEQEARNAQLTQQDLQDQQELEAFNEQGYDNVEYYATGGNLDQNMSPDQMSMLAQNLTQSGGNHPNLPISNGGFQTKGGNLIPIGDGVEEVVGNRHNDTKIDGVSGVQLFENGNLTAEVEKNEVIADGRVVYSDRLKYDKNNSYADKMRKIVKARNKKEEEQETTKDKRRKNTLDRQLAGLNMAEEVLFKHQEAKKEKEGQRVLNHLAKGGVIPKYAPGGVLDQLPVRRQFLLDKKKKGEPLTKEEEIELNTQLNTKDIDFNNSTYLKSATAPVQVDNTAKSLLSVAGSAMNVINAANSNSTTPNTTTPTDVATSVTAQTPTDVSTPATNTENTNTEDDSKKINWNGVLNNVAKYAPLLIDNVGNYIMNKNAPKLSTPLTNRAMPLETKVNVNPQLAETRRRNKSVKEAIVRNTSNSNNAKNNMVAASLAESRNTDAVLSEKGNQERTLRNTNAQNRQIVNTQNTALMNDHMFKEFQRQNDIQTRNSANLANLQGDIQTIHTGLRLDKKYNQDAMNNLADDEFGSKAVVYVDNEEFMSNSSNRKAVIEKANETDSSGKYKYPALRTKLAAKGLI